MPQNFIACDREQELLLPPSLREWLPDDHFAWFVIDAVGALDLTAFLAAYRHDGWGRAAHNPAMMVALIVYAYAIGERSSRRIERRCREDVAFRVITANQVPDHATIARFRVRHERVLSKLFGQVLRLCADAGMVRVGVIAVDGTKVHANASERATRDYEQIAREILEQAAEVDALEDEQFGERRGDELPPGVATREGRQRWLRDARSTPLRFSPTTSVPARPGRSGLASTGTAPGSRPGYRPGFPGHRPGIPRARRAHPEREPGHTSLQIKPAGAWPRSSDAGHARHGKEARWPQSLT